MITSDDRRGNCCQPQCCPFTFDFATAGTDLLVTAAVPDGTERTLDGLAALAASATARPLTP